MSKLSLFSLTQVACMAMLLILTPLAFAADEPIPNTAQVAQVDINKASAAAIAEALDGIGMVKAEEIVAYREMFGDFISVDELVEVQGVGMGTVERNRDRIVIVSN